MANIYCTKRLQKLLGKQMMAEDDSNSKFGAWNANLFYIEGRKCIIVMNDRTCYSVLFLDVLKRDLMDFGRLFLNRLLEQLNYDGIVVTEHCKRLLTEHSNPHFLVTNNNRRILGTMVQFVKDLDYYIYEYGSDLRGIDICQLNHRITDNYVTALSEKKYDFKNPIELMRVKIIKACA